MTTGTQQRHARRWVLPFLAALIAALAAILGFTTASASAAGVAETRVGAFNVAGEVPVGPPQHVSAGQSRDAAEISHQIVVATGVATKTARGLPTPVVESAKLQNIVNNLYKGTTNPNRVGYGTTMDAIRNEIATGSPTGRRMHITKGQESLQGLDNWLAKNPAAPDHDRLVAQSLADELREVLP
jgi:hypothetical protein